jgi:HK97 family phage major capsid protein
MTVTAPSLEELEATLADKSKVANLVTEGKFGDFIKDYAQAKQDAAGDLATAVKEETQKVLAQMLKDNGAQMLKRPNLDVKGGDVNARARNRIYNKRAPGAILDDKFADAAEFFQSIWHHSDTLADNETLKAKRSELQKIRNSFGSTVPADGGFLIPEELRSEILSNSLETSIVRPRARIVPMSSLTLPFPAVDETSHAATVFGGLVAYWTEEGATATESQAAFTTVKLEAKKLVIYCEVPNELVADAPAFQMFLNEMLPEATGYFEDDAFLTGSGVGEPLGVLNGDAIVPVTETTSNLIDWPDIVSMFSRVLPASMSRGVWVAAPDTFPQLATMTVNVQNVAGTENVGGSAIWLNNGVVGPPVTILGRPVIFSEKVPALGTTGALSFIDFGYYLIGDRQAMQASSSAHVKFASDKTAYKIVERVDGRPWLNSALTPRNGSSNTLSPFVTLASA